jgi:predicted GIY-YIG superfamily endonuclease
VLAKQVYRTMNSKKKTIMEPFFIYILRCNDTSYYIGQTDNIEKRIAEHNQALMPGYTSSRLPVTCVFVQTFSSRIEALEAEQKIKKWSRKKKEALINQDWNEISKLAKKKFKT